MVRLRKMFLVILTLMGIQTLAQAQVKVDHEFGHRFIFDLMAIDSPSMIRERVYSDADDTAIYRIFSKLTRPGVEPVSPILLAVKTVNHGVATQFDSEGLPLDLHLPADSIDVYAIWCGPCPAIRSTCSSIKKENLSISGHCAPLTEIA